MNDKNTRRRRFLVAALTFSTVATALPGTAWLRSSAAWADASASADLDVMAILARRLFPHDEIPDSVYAAVMGNVFAALAGNPASEGLLAAAEQALDAFSDEAWIELEKSKQIAAIESIQDAPFFGAILGTVRGAFYYDPAVWPYIDYPGSSKEYGGYINRGFDDIDWLPGEA